MSNIKGIYKRELNSNLKNIFLLKFKISKIISLLSVILFLNSAYGDNIEGVWSSIDQSKAVDLLDSSISTKDLLEFESTKINKLSVKNQHSAYLKLMHDIIEISEKKQNETLMRVTINRSLEIDKILSETTELTEESKGLRLRLLKDAIILALHVYEEDFKVLNWIQNLGEIKSSSFLDLPEFETFAESSIKYEIEYAKYLIKQAFDITSHKGEFKILKFVLTQLYNGLESSLHRRLFYKAITKIVDVNSKLPLEIPTCPIEASKLIRNLNSSLESIVKSAEEVKINTHIAFQKPITKRFDCGINSVGMRFICIPAGEFLMDDRNLRGDAHMVTIRSNLQIQETEVTQEHWEEIMGENPSYFKGKNYPVESVSIDMIRNYINKLNEKKDGYFYRLPTEEEWEYVARAGSKTIFFWGDNPDFAIRYSWNKLNSSHQTHEVAQLSPNGFGVYDIIGNVFELVDRSENSEDPYPLLRGGDFDTESNNSYTGRKRKSNTLEARGINFGFRLVRTAISQQ